MLLLTLVCNKQSYAQNTWQTATVMVADTTYDSITSSYTDYWFSYKPDIAILELNISDTSQYWNSNIIKLYLFIEDNSGISVVDSCILDSIGIVKFDNLIVDSMYYIKTVYYLPNTNWSIQTSTIKKPVIYEYLDNSECLPVECVNLISNGDFEEIAQSVIHLFTLGNIIPDPFAQVNINKDYIYPICGWRRYGYPFHSGIHVSALRNSPQIKRLNISLYAGFALWNQTVQNTTQEFFYTEIDLAPNSEYSIEFDYRMSNVTGQNHEGQVVLSVDQAPDYTSLSNGTAISVYGTNQTNHHSSTFITGSNPYQSLSVLSNTPGESIKIDNIVVYPTAASAAPIVTGPTTTCDPILDPNGDYFTFSIDNFQSSVADYEYILNGGNAVPVSSNTFIILLSELSECINTITLSDKCGNSVGFEVRQCCEDPSYYMRHDGYLTDNDITTAYNTYGPNILINDEVKINENIDLTLYNIGFGPMAKITLEDGAQFKLIQCELYDLCGCPWDGIYVDEEESIIMEETCVVSGAYNAVVARDNCYVNISSSTFKNNEIGILLEQYCPELCGSLPLPPIPSRNASIKDNTFKVDVSSNLYFDEYIGIEIDSVYDVTIGDEFNEDSHNTFDNLYVGIRIDDSYVSIYNNIFNNINDGYGYTNPLTPNNKPYYATAILASEKLSINPLDLPIPTGQCVKPHIIVGSKNARNVFDNCMFGVYSYDHEAEISGNVFTNQRKNAVWVWDAKSNIYGNTIEQYPATNPISHVFNCAILVEHTFIPSANNDHQYTYILNNTISNARTGIKVTHCASSIYNNDYILINGNTITFDDFNFEGGMEEYSSIGIFLEGCTRAEVRINSIINNLGQMPDVDYYKNLIGIRVDDTQESKIEDNLEVIKNMGTGIWVNGDCINTQFSCNVFDNCHKGVYSYTDILLGFAADISDQGSYSRTQDNQFKNMTNAMDERVGGYLVNQGREWFFREYYLDYDPYLLSSDHTPTYSDTPTEDCFSFAKTYSPGIGDDGFNTYKTLLYQDIAMDSINYSAFDYNFDFSNKEYLYRTLFYNPTMIDASNLGDSIYFNFLNNNLDIESLINIQEAIEINDTTTAFALNNNLNTDSLIMQNRQKVNDIYLTSFAQNRYFNVVQEEQLIEIASQTVANGGDAVYSARVMLGYNPLENPNNERGLHITNPNPPQIDPENPVKLYPNPATNNLTIEFIDVLENNATFVLYDLSGREVAKYTLTEKTNIFNINISKLQSGIYIYSVNSDDVTTGKLIIN